MTEISYFQKYSQRENHITNNTMLMFRHIYKLIQRVVTLHLDTIKIVNNLPALDLPEDKQAQKAAR